LLERLAERPVRYQSRGWTGNYITYCVMVNMGDGQIVKLHLTGSPIVVLFFVWTSVERVHIVLDKPGPLELGVFGHHPVICIDDMRQSHFIFLQLLNVILPAL
jgi:hypothetical protein